MSEPTVSRAPVGWLLGGLMLGLVQVAAVYLHSPLGVSTQFVVADTQALEAVAPTYVEHHAVISSPKYREPGYGWWLAIGIVVGAFAAAVVTGRFRPRPIPVWWEVNHGPRLGKRLLVAFGAGVLVLLGSRLAHGCTSGQFASGWAQLSVAAVPFTLALFGLGMITARLAYPRTPRMED